MILDLNCKNTFLSPNIGWNHHYNYKLYVNGPYSTAIAEDYYSKDFLNYTPIKINDFNLNSFNKFISKKTNHFLEATSTILYEDLSSLNSTITKLNKIKPYISSEIVEKSFKNIIEFNLEKSLIANYNYHENLIHMKKKLIEKMKYYIDYFEDFGQCNNGIIISGSVDYLRIVLREENLNDELKSDLLEIIRKYLLYL